MDETNVVDEDHIAANVKTYLQLCQDCYKDQEDLRKELTSRTMAIVTFGAALFGLSASWKGQPGTIAVWAFLVPMALCLVVMSVLAICFIVKPGTWNDPFTLEDYEGLYAEKDRASFEASLAHTYMLASRENKGILERRKRLLSTISWFALAEICAFSIMASLSGLT